MKNVSSFFPFKSLLIIAPLCLWTTAASASPVLYTFDDLLGSPWPNPYGGLTWGNFDSENVPTVTTEFGPSGYQAGLISSPNDVYNGSGNPASISRSGAFDFDSAYMTAAIMDNLRLEAKGYLNGVLEYDNTYILSATSPTLIHFNYLGVNTVDLITSGGTPHGYPGFAPGEQFAMDNLTVDLNPIPEPGIAAFFALGGIAFVCRIRDKKFDRFKRAAHSRLVKR